MAGPMSSENGSVVPVVHLWGGVHEALRANISETVLVLLINHYCPAKAGCANSK
jgi:hypothetical protein